jgi:hypothetical protein
MLQSTYLNKNSRSTRRKHGDNIMWAMMKATVGLPGGKEMVTKKINPPQPEMGAVCVWCGEEPCEWWSEVTEQIRNYHRYHVEMIGPDQLPPHNMMREPMHREMAMLQGFVRCEEHPYCIHLGIHNLSPSPDGNYMGHKYV